MHQTKFAFEEIPAQFAQDGESALTMLREAGSKLPVVVLLDLMMPEMNGDQVLVELRKTEWGKDMKVIILTNMGEQEAPEILKTLNVLAFIVKADMTPKQVADLVKAKLAA